MIYVNRRVSSRFSRQHPILSGNSLLPVVQRFNRSAAECCPAFQRPQSSVVKGTLVITPPNIALIQVKGLST